jgi:hypothetical protein
MAVPLLQVAEMKRTGRDSVPRAREPLRSFPQRNAEYFHFGLGRSYRITRQMGFSLGERFASVSTGDCEVHPINEQIAGRLEEVARLLRDQGADPFRVGAYLRAAAAIRSSCEPADEIYRLHGIVGLKALPRVGESIAHAVSELLTHGRLPILDLLRGKTHPTALLASLPGMGRVLAERVHDELGVETLADLEEAAHDGRLAAVAGFGEKRLAGIRDSLASRRGNASVPPSPGPRATVGELIDVDREYRDKAAAGQLQLITPRRFNPMRQAWLPILHTRRGMRRYTALFSNTARAHRNGKTRDWVVLYSDNATGDTRHTVITASFGPLRGRRIVVGREDECEALYGVSQMPTSTRWVGRRRWPGRIRDQAS